MIIFCQAYDKLVWEGFDPNKSREYQEALNEAKEYELNNAQLMSDIEDFKTGEYKKESPEEGETIEDMKRRLYEKFIKNRNSFLLYQWGCWCTSIAMFQLFKLGECTEYDLVCDGKYKLYRWIYSDTDSIYSDRWNEEKVEAFNAECRKLLLANGYDMNSVNKDELEKNQADDKLKNSHLRSLEKESHDLEVSINRIEVKLDNMLETLSTEYEMTYERAKNEYSLDIEPEDARVKVNTFKANIKRIGMVNLDAIDEYERVNSRYEFLTTQREDLLKALKKYLQ